MKEQIHTIPVNEAFDSGDECPFCYLQRQVEQRTIRYVVGPGASYMEPEVRLATDKAGFCREHTKKLYDYGNTLGTALILQTHYARLLEQFQADAAKFAPPGKKNLLGVRRGGEASDLPQRLHDQARSCYICDKIDYNMERYYHTFCVLAKEPEFRAKVESSKGFCLRHFGELLAAAEERLPNGQYEWFYDTVFPLMEQHLVRVKEDLDWLIAKFDYRNASAPWKNSQDALKRAMQKVEGIYPADPPYKQDK